MTKPQILSAISQCRQWREFFIGMKMFDMVDNVNDRLESLYWLYLETKTEE